MGELTKYDARCLNCGNPLNEGDEFCSHCGQRTRGTKVPLKDFLADFFEVYFTVDAKFFKSILLLMVIPGALTKRYNRGMRKRYIAPFRMYLFTSFIYFFLLARSVNQEEIFNASAVSAKASGLDSLIENRVTNIHPDSLRQTADLPEKSYENAKILDFGEEGDSLFTSENTFGGRLRNFLIEKSNRANEDPDDFIRSLLRSASVTLFFLLPVFAFILWAFHFRRAP